MNQAPALASDRREYFRINDQVALEYHLIDATELSEAVQARNEGPQDTVSIATSFAKSNADLTPGLEKCRKQFPEIAAYLDGVNTKVDFLIRLLVATQTQMPDKPTHEINLSASGFSFLSAQPIDVESFLTLKILFFPSYVFLSAFARVARCRALQPDDSKTMYDIGVEFVHLTEADQELLIRHVLQREATMLREARSEPVSLA